MFSPMSASSMIGRGILAIIVGVIALAWPGITVLALVILFAVYAFIDAGLQTARAFGSRSAGPVFGHLLLALVDIGAGIVALVWPGITALVLVLVVAIWAVVAGVAEIVSGFGRGEVAGTRAMFILTGLVSIALGVVLFAHPRIGALTLAVVFGLFSFVYGVAQITAGVQARHTPKAGHPSHPTGAMRPGTVSCRRSAAQPGRSARAKEAEPGCVILGRPHAPCAIRPYEMPASSRAHTGRSGRWVPCLPEEKSARALAIASYQALAAVRC